jgi:hypothetical protein
VLVPMLQKLQQLPKELGRTRRILADNGYFSEGNVQQCTAAKIEPLIAMGRTRHQMSWKQRFARAPKSAPEAATPVQKMAYRLKTPEGRRLYALRKQTELGEPCPMDLNRIAELAREDPGRKFLSIAHLLTPRALCFE